MAAERFIDPDASKMNMTLVWADASPAAAAAAAKVNAPKNRVIDCRDMLLSLVLEIKSVGGRIGWDVRAGATIARRLLVQKLVDRGGQRADARILVLVTGVDVEDGRSDPGNA
jgi:hypothetical protein